MQLKLNWNVPQTNHLDVEWKLNLKWTVGADMRNLNEDESTSQKLMMITDEEVINLKSAIITE